MSYKVMILWNGKVSNWYTADTIPDVCAMDGSRIWGMFVYASEGSINPVEAYITTRENTFYAVTLGK